MKKILTDTFKKIFMILNGLLKVIGLILKPLVWILSIFSSVSSVGQQTHMNTQRQTEMLAQYKSADVKEKINKNQDNTRY